MLRRIFLSPEALRRFPFGLADIAVILGTLVILSLMARVGAGTLVSFVPPDTVPGISLDPRNLPYYAGLGDQLCESLSRCLPRRCLP